MQTAFVERMRKSANRLQGQARIICRNMGVKSVYEKSLLRL
jgi:hypothetical protein